VPNAGDGAVVSRAGCGSRRRGTRLRVALKAHGSLSPANHRPTGHVTPDCRHCRRAAAIMIFTEVSLRLRPEFQDRWHCAAAPPHHEDATDSDDPAPASDSDWAVTSPHHSYHSRRSHHSRRSPCAPRRLGFGGSAAPCRGARSSRLYRHLVRVCRAKGSALEAASTSGRGQSRRAAHRPRLLS
jgi:hypothetical protein